MRSVKKGNVVMRLGKYLSSLTKPELEALKEQLNLSDDEAPVFEHLAKGRSKVSVADRCLISESTVDNRIKSISNKLKKIDPTI